MGIILFIVALILTSLVSIISIVISPVYYFVTFKWWTGLWQLNYWFRQMALAIDQFGNVSCGITLQLLLTKKGGNKFGDEDDTVSYVLGRNYYKGKLTWLGRVIVKVLNLLEKNHVTIAIEKKIESDKSDSWRSRYEKYFS